MKKERIICSYNEGLPSLRISTASGCNHRCSFCQIEGDFASDHGVLQKQSSEMLLTVSKRFFGLGVRHFSITGGEPLVNPKVTFEVAAELRGLLDSDASESYLRLNTNGVHLLKWIDPTAAMFDLVKVSLHTLNEQIYASVTNCRSARDDLRAVIGGIDRLGELGKNVRLQTVVGRFNVDEVGDLIAFAEEMPAVKEIKLFDISEYSELWRGDEAGASYWRREYVDLEPLQRSIGSTAQFVGTAYSVGGYGNPMPIYETKSGLRIRIRRTDLGAFYGPACADCVALPFCGDGHCNLEIGPNRVIKVCRPKEGRVFAIGDEAQAVEYFRRTSKSVNQHRQEAIRRTFSSAPD